MFGFGSTIIARPVRGGQIFCLVEGRRVDPERCATCDMLESVVTDDADSPVDVLCRPPLAALLSPDDEQGLFGLDWGR